MMGPRHCASSITALILLTILTLASSLIRHSAPSVLPSLARPRLNPLISLRRPHSRQTWGGTSLNSSPSNSNTHDASAWGLNVAIVGAGPSGLLLAHRLAQSQSLPINNVDVYESRSDPRNIPKLALGSRAYALGLGVRGRAAIRSIDEELWSAVKKRGFECERFRLHISSKFSIKLRDKLDDIEPSLLIYQTDLCAALLDELDMRTYSDCHVNVNFDSNITHVNLQGGEISVKTNKEGTAMPEQKGAYDLIVGCDGSNSIVRAAIRDYSPPNTFSFVQRKLLPGCFKVARSMKMPPQLDPASVGLLLPKSKSLGITAFVEPTVDGGACILFAGRLGNATIKQDEVDLGSVIFPDPGSKQERQSPPEVGLLSSLVLEQFPLLDGTPGMDDVVRQLLSQRTSVAESVKCNIYHSNSDVTATVLCGDAAHATGGVSGQGCNSALKDAVALADCLVEQFKPLDDPSDSVQNAKRAMLHKSVVSYSQKSVPEGHALYDLSFGNDGKTLPIFKDLRARLSNAIDSVFAGRLGIGKKPLQTLLASSPSPFVDIRRDREKYYVDEFPTDEYWKSVIGELYQKGDEKEG